MNFNKLLISSCASLLFIASACDKNDGNDDKKGPVTIDGKNTQQIVMMQPWRWHTELDSVESGDKWLKNMADCNTDDVYNFNTTTEVTINEGDLDCLPTTPREYKAAWSMPSATGKTIVMPDASYTILSQTNDEMVMYRSFFGFGETHHIKRFYRKN